MIEDVQSETSREEMRDIKRIIALLPELQALAEAIGADKAVAWLEEAAQAAAKIVHGFGSAELH